MSSQDPDETLPPKQTHSDLSSGGLDSNFDLSSDDMAHLDQAELETAAFDVDPGQTLDQKRAVDATADFSIDPEATADFQTSPRHKKNLPKSFSLQIPGYEILGELGRGAMGVVYAARQIKADRTVALKVMLNLDHANPESVERFKVEAQAAARLQHPHIVQVYDVNESAGCPYFTLEYVTGGTLSRKIDEQMLSVQEAAVLMRTLAEAMAFAHDKGIVHRDLKPANIMLDATGQPKIADFGLARRLEDTSHLTQDGTVVGTPSYMAPEQTLGDPALIKPAVDIYALGAVLFELLTGRPPFKAASLWEVLRQVRSADPVRPSELQPGIPLDLETICLKCLQKEPANRYESALALQQDLQRFLNNEPILARPIGQWERLVRLCKRHPREAILVGSLAALLTVFAIGASIVAYRISQDRNHIAQQSEKIEKQRDQIQQEKDLSDNRLTMYRDTVSSLVNRAPRLLESSPIGGNTKRELTELLNQVLSQSPDSDSVGSSKQWGIMATHLRQAESALTEAVAAGSAHAQQKFSEARDQLQTAVEIAKSVYESDEPDRVKAASNYSIVLAKSAQALFVSDPQLANEAVPLFKLSIDLANEAVELSLAPSANTTDNTENTETSSSGASNKAVAAAAEYRMKKGDRQYQYSDFLMKFKPGDPKYQNRSIELTSDAQSIYREILAIENLPESLREDTLQNLGLASKLLAEIYQIRSEPEKSVLAFDESIASFQTLVISAPYRPVFRRNLATVANQYGQHLLMNHGDPNRIKEVYKIARQAIESLTRTSDLKFLEQAGLAINWYALGLTAEQQNETVEATRCYLMAATLRERQYREAEDDFIIGKTQDRVEQLYHLSNWTLCLARAGQKDLVLSNIKKLYADIGSYKLAPDQSRDLYSTSAAALGILAHHFPEPSADRKSLGEKAITLLEKSIEAGYQDRAYLETDPDFQWLNKDGKLKRILELMDANR